MSIDIAAVSTDNCSLETCSPLRRAPLSFYNYIPIVSVLNDHRHVAREAFPTRPCKDQSPPDLSSISPTKFNSISLLQQIIASNTFSRAFAISYTSSRACYQVHVSRVAISYTFSRAFYQFHDFPRLLSVTCFSRLAISYMFVNPDWFSTLQS